ncbi:phenylalanine--tRNA ligase subunit beta [Patescibacteria group bacterium]|nr:phenylalanine--tRNA ligase subunit beta [Patescibacteria group bacterium]
MNILVSYNWLKEYLQTNLSAEDFAAKTTNAGNSVEYIENMAHRFDHMVVGEITNIKDHPNADRLKIAEVKIGTMKKVEIVCGGVNLRVDMKVAVALPGSKVIWHGEGEPVELHETEVRGVKSYGMICAAAELGFPKYPQGEKDIWDLTNVTTEKAGVPLYNALGMDDAVFDIEVTSNRPDAASIIGQAREGSACTGDKFLWQAKDVMPDGIARAKVEVAVRETELCPKYEAVLLDNVKVGPSPWWLQKRLLLSGHRPINNIVDVTNYVLHEYGQPLHAFDADKLDHGIVVRKAEKGEKFLALDGNEYDLSKDMLVVADHAKPIAIAGVMGGEETGTTVETTRVILEAATFNPVSVRRTARALNLHSDSSAQFERGLSTQSTRPALARAVELIKEIADAQVASEVTSVQAEPYQREAFPFDPKEAKALMGVALSDHEMISILERLGFEVKEAGSNYEVKVPYWRDHDIENKVDLVEEIARVYGYEKIPSILPAGEIDPEHQDQTIVWERRVKELLRGSGLSETYAMSFISGKELSNAGYDPEMSVKLQNPLASDLEYMRPCLIPTMLTTIEKNQRMFPEAQLFELAPIYLPNKEDIPNHKMQLLMAIYEKDGACAFTKAKGILERLMREAGVRQYRFERPESSDSSPLPRGRSGGGLECLLHPTRSANVWVGNHEHVGRIGEVDKQVLNAFGIEQSVILIDLDFDALVPHLSLAKTYTPVPLYPEVKRDLAFVLDRTVEFSQIEAKLKEASGLLREVELFDTYCGSGVEAGKKSLAVHLTFRLADRTLEADEVDEEIAKLRNVLQEQFSATMRS